MNPQERFGGVPELVLIWAVVIVYCLAGGLAGLLAFALVSHCIVRGSIRAIGKPPGG